MKKLLIIALMIGLPCYAETIGSVRNDWVKPIIEQEKQNKVITEAEFDKLYRTWEEMLPELYIFFIDDRDENAYLKATDDYKPITKLDLIYPVNGGYSTVKYVLDYRYLVKRYKYLGKDWTDYLRIKAKQQDKLKVEGRRVVYYFENISFPPEYCLIWIDEWHEYLNTHSNPYTEKLVKDIIKQMTLDFINYMYWDMCTYPDYIIDHYKAVCEEYLAKPRDTEEYQIIKQWHELLKSTDYKWDSKLGTFVDQLG